MWAKFNEFHWETTCHSIVKCHELLYVSRATETRQNCIIQMIDTVTLSQLNVNLKNPIFSNLNHSLQEITIENTPKCRLSASETTLACLGKNLKIFSGGIKPKNLWSYDLKDNEPVNVRI